MKVNQSIAEIRKQKTHYKQQHNQKNSKNTYKNTYKNWKNKQTKTQLYLKAFGAGGVDGIGTEQGNPMK